MIRFWLAPVLCSLLLVSCATSPTGRSQLLIDDPDIPNAWCMPGGLMAIYTGLVYGLDLNDDEIAQIMGHEIGHAIANHSAEQMSIAGLQEIASAVVARASLKIRNWRGDTRVRI